MYLRAGICIAVRGDRPNLSSTVVKQAVINLGGRGTSGKRVVVLQYSVVENYYPYY